MAKNSLRYVTLLLSVLMASHSAFAFRSTNFESFTDPDYKDYMPRKVLVLVVNASNEVRETIEERFADQLSGYGVEVVKYRNLFPPTREWSPEAQSAILQENSVDSCLIVTAGKSAASVMTVGSQSHGTTNVNAYGGNYAQANSTSTTNSIVVAKSTAEFSAVLVDVAKNQTAWYADITTKARGTWFVGDKGDAKGLVKGVVEGLATDGHIRKQK